VRKGTVHDVRLRLPGGRVVTRTFPTIGEARRYETIQRAARYRGDWADPANLRRPLQAVADEWCDANVAKRASTRARDRSALDRHILPRLGHRRVGSIRRQDVREAVAAWSTVLAPRSVRRVFGVLRAVLNHAFEDSEGAVRNPCTGVRLPRVSRRSRPRPTPAQLTALARAIPERYEAMVWVAALTGLRWGEVAGLTVGRLHLARPSTLTVDRQVGRDERGRSVVEEPKSEAGIRALAIPDELATILVEHLDRAGLVEADEDALLFPAPDGGLLRYGEWRRNAWVPAAIAAGFCREVADDRERDRMRIVPTLGFHDLRRLNATEMVRLNVDIKTAQHRLGHSDPRLTLAVYAEATTEADVEAANRLGARLLARRAESTG
jgi:integrase